LDHPESYVSTSQQRTATLHSLEQGFLAFNRVSTQLAQSYQRLEDRVALLDSQLRTGAATISDADRLSRILNALPVGVIVINGQGLIIEHNALAEHLLGVELRAQVWRDVAAQVFIPQSDDGQDISLRNGRKLNLSTCPLGSEPGQILLLSDVTETRRLQERLNQLQRLGTLGEMAAGLAHQIRTPLSAGLLYASQLKNPRLTQEQQTQVVGKLVAQLGQLESLVSDMLLFAKRRYAGDDRVAVPELLNELKQAVLPMIESQQLSLRISAPAIDGVVLGNGRVLLSALQNLVVNAAQATAPGGRIEILAVQELSNAIDISVSDNGCGIPGNLRGRIFEPFVTTRNNGTGLGLAVVRSIVQAHDGEIWLAHSSEAGTQFTLRLPLHADKTVNEQPHNEAM
jgi:two-component system sensor histidine kinase FlrB